MSVFDRDPNDLDPANHWQECRACGVDTDATYCPECDPRQGALERDPLDAPEREEA